MPDAQLRIGVDARPLCHPGTGIYRYTRELLTRMCAMGGQWFLYSPQAFDTEGLDLETVTHRMANVPAYLGGSQASQLLFPRWASRDAIDLFWGPRHHLPRLLPGAVPAVLTVHDLVWQQQGASMPAYRRLTERLLMPASLRRAQHIVTGTDYIAAQLREAFPGARGKLSVIPYGSSFEPKEGHTPAGRFERGYFLFVGTMEPWKNLPGLLDAYRSYLARALNPRDLRLVGGVGLGGIDTATLVSDRGLADRVEIIRGVSDQQLSRIYDGAFALVLPSFYEGFGLPVVEALAHGVPVIVSRNSALSEVAGEAAYPVNPRASEEIGNAMLGLGDDFDLYCRLHASAGEQALKYRWDDSAAKMYAILCNQM